MSLQRGEGAFEGRISGGLRASSGKAVSRSRARSFVVEGAEECNSYESEIVSPSSSSVHILVVTFLVRHRKTIRRREEESWARL